jgi:hypothetical protein
MASATGLDIVEVLSDEHALLRRLSRDVTEPGGDGSAFLTWSDQVVRHEIAEELVVYPALLSCHGGAAVAHSRLEEQAGIERRLVAVGRLVPGSPEFRRAAVGLVLTSLAHLETEEAQVLPILSTRIGEDRRVDLGRRYQEVTRMAPRPPAHAGARVPRGPMVVDRTEALSVWLRDMAASSGLAS